MIYSLSAQTNERLDEGKFYGLDRPADRPSCRVLVKWTVEEIAR